MIQIINRSCRSTDRLSCFSNEVSLGIWCKLIHHDSRLPPAPAILLPNSRSQRRSAHPRRSVHTLVGGRLADHYLVCWDSFGDELVDRCFGGPAGWSSEEGLIGVVGGASLAIVLDIIKVYQISHLGVNVQITSVSEGRLTCKITCIYTMNEKCIG